MSILHPQECYLIEQTLSLESYKKRYLEYKAAIEIAETRYQEVMQHIPSDFRSRPSNQQLDLTWGSRVLPNLRQTLKRLEEDYVLRSRDDLKAYPSGGLVGSDVRGMFSHMGVDLSWMGEEVERKFCDHFFSASAIDSNIKSSTGNWWTEGDLTWGFEINNESSDFGLTLPSRIPRYELVPEEVIKIGEKPRIIGLYLPHVERAAVSFLYPHVTDYTIEAFQAEGLKRFVDEDTGKVSYSWKNRVRTPSTLTLIRRIEGEYLDVPPEGFFPNHHPEELYNWPEREKQYLSQQDSTRIVAWSGDICPHSGRWSTLMYRGVEFAQLEQGQKMPVWVDENGASQKTKWTLLTRDDGCSPLVMNTAD